jgi:nucleoside-diphosphate-sugar epimerase
VDALMDTRHELRVLDALLYEECYRKVVPFYYVDVRDHSALLPHLEWADAVIWLAAVVGDGACALNPEVTTEINQSAVERLAQSYDGRIVFTSTCSVYGVQEEAVHEASPTRPLSVYAATKLQSEKCLRNSNAIIFRLGTLFGVGDLYSRIRFDLVVNQFVVKACALGRIKIYGGEQFRPLLHVRDAARLAVASIETDRVGVFNLLRQNVRIMDLAYQVRNHFPQLEIERTEMQVEDTRNYCVSCEKAKRELQFTARYSIDEGIDEIKELVFSRRIKDFDNPRYTNQMYLSLFNTHIAAKEKIAV